MTQQRPPRIGQAIARNQVPLPQSKRAAHQIEPQVEVSKIDPADVLRPRPAPRAGSEADILAHAEAFQPAPPAPPVETEKKAVAMELPPPEDTSTTSFIKDSLLDRLSARFGLTAPPTKDVFLEGGDQVVGATVRRPVYDDYVWTMGRIEEMLENGQDLGLIGNTLQRKSYMDHISACRCVVKIEGEYVWDVFQYSTLIKQANPAWDGENFAGIPDSLAGALAQNVHVLFRQLHPDLLFDLSRVVKNAWSETANPEGTAADSQEPPEPETPTEAT